MWKPKHVACWQLKTCTWSQAFNVLSDSWVANILCVRAVGKPLCELHRKLACGVAHDFEVQLNPWMCLGPWLRLRGRLLAHLNRWHLSHQVTIIFIASIFRAIWGDSPLLNHHLGWGKQFGRYRLTRSMIYTVYTRVKWNVYQRGLFLKPVYGPVRLPFRKPTDIYWHTEHPSWIPEVSFLANHLSPVHYWESTETIISDTCRWNWGTNNEILVFVQILDSYWAPFDIFRSLKTCNQSASESETLCATCHSLVI